MKTVKYRVQEAREWLSDLYWCSFEWECAAKLWTDLLLTCWIGAFDCVLLMWIGDYFERPMWWLITPMWWLFIAGLPVLVLAVIASAIRNKNARLEELEAAREYDPEPIYGNAHNVRDAEIWGHYFEP